MLSSGGGSAGPLFLLSSRPQPPANIRLSAPKSSEKIINRKTESQKPKKKSLYVRKEFPETWLWTEEMVK